MPSSSHNPIHCVSATSLQTPIALTATQHRHHHTAITCEYVLLHISGSLQQIKPSEKNAGNQRDKNPVHFQPQRLSGFLERAPSLALLLN